MIRFRCISLMIIGLVAALPAASPAVADEYRADPVHSTLVFKIGHLNISSIYGRFNGLSGTIAYDPDNPAKNRVEMSVPAANVDTNNPDRDAHLKSPDFFDADKHPGIRFKSVSFTPKGDGVYNVSGDLTLHGTTRRITVAVKRTGMGKDPWGGTRIGFETDFSIRRSDYGMTTMLDLVGDRVDLHMAVEAVLE